MSPETVKAAKIAHARTHGEDASDLAKLNFRKVLDTAVTNHLSTISAGLSTLGLIKSEGVKNRQRPVSIAAWEALGKVADEHGLSRVQLVRAVLTLLGRDAP